MKETKYLTVKDIGIALNNACAAAFNTKEVSGLNAGGQRKLRNYLEAILEVILEHRKQGYLTAEELVAVFSAGALFLHILLVAKGSLGKLSMFSDISKRMLEDSGETD